MAILRNAMTGETALAEAEHIFGRAPTSSSLVTAAYVSAQHASLRWVRGRWILRDLGSRNGTFVDGQRIATSDEKPVFAGMTLAFGKPDKNVWELVDDGPPSIMAVPAEGGRPVLMDGDLLAIPSSDDPQVTIFRTADTEWMIESADDALTSIRNLQTFTAGGRTWRFCCPDEVRETALATAQRDLEIRHLRLTFFVSRDEEHVALRLTCGGRAIDMGSRLHNYFLLTLARRRLEDMASGLVESSCGWMYQDDLTRGLQISGSLHLNLDVYRVRRHFGSAGVSDAPGIIERRPRTRQLRIGASNLEVVRL